MANDLAGYRGDLDNLLATAVDSSTWTTTLKDEALRNALHELNDQLVYEDSFTVTVAGYSQDMSGMSGILRILALAYPWEDGCSFGEHLAEWRSVGVNIVYFVRQELQVGDVVRVRLNKLHVIDDLDSAVATTVPDSYRNLVGLWAAAFCCEMRIRQISENPALPREAAGHLGRVAQQFRVRATEALGHAPPLGWLRWGELGLF